MLSRKEYIKVCQTCTRRKFNPKKGVVCSLTGEIAAFKGSNCDDYDADIIAENKEIKAAHERQVRKEEGATLGLSKIGIKNPILAGLIVTAVSLTLSLFFLFYLDSISTYLIIGLILGIACTVKGCIDHYKNAKAFAKQENGVLDDQLNEL